LTLQTKGFHRFLPFLQIKSVQLWGELADRIQAISAGGLGVIQQMVKQLDLADSINRLCPIFKMRLPYSEADHVFRIAEKT
jgi:hypothetical protein